jgi:hypothetical protein
VKEYTREPHGLVLLATSWWEISSIGASLGIPLVGREERKAKFWEKRKGKGERMEVVRCVLLCLKEKGFKLRLGGEELGREGSLGQGKKERGCNPKKPSETERETECVCVCVLVAFFSRSNQKRSGFKLAVLLRY